MYQLINPLNDEKTDQFFELLFEELNSLGVKNTPKEKRYILGFLITEPEDIVDILEDCMFSNTIH
jgi:hypothetical protein